MAGSRVAAALADHDLALAVLIGGMTTVGGDTRQITRGTLGQTLKWSRLSEQILRADKWKLCQSYEDS